MRQPRYQHLDPLDPPDRRPTPPAVPGKYLSLTSFRRDGTGVATPVWFVEAGGRLLVETDAASYKVRRIRRNPQVTIAPCTATGRRRGIPCRRGPSYCPTPRWHGWTG